MATLTIKNVPDDLYARLKARAVRNRRSLNQESLAILEAIDSPATDTAAERARALRERLARDGAWVTAEEVDAWITEGQR